jgi:choline dehydrogenase-like flavoprotein
MFHDAREIEEGSELHSDVCVIGAGPAGIAVASELSGTGLDVSMLVGAGFEEDRRDQKLYSGLNVGLQSYSTYLSRSRRFGGATSRWGGMSRPFEPIDFEERAWIRHSGWPITADELSPYYRRAHGVAGLGPYDYRVEPWSSRKRSALPVDVRRIELRTYRFTSPLDLGAAHRESLEASQDVDVFFHAHAVELEVDEQARRLTGVRAMTSDGRSIRFAARRYVLACGGLENPRLLLASNKVVAAGLGNEHDLVGRFFTDHPFFYMGWYEPAPQAPPCGLHVIQDYTKVGSEQLAVVAFALAEDIVRCEHLNGAVLYMTSRPRHKTLPVYTAPARQSLNALVDGIFGPDELGPDSVRHVRRVLSGLPGVAKSFVHQAADIVRPEQRLSLRCTLEATPNPESRVRLGRRRDRFGMPRIELDWRLNDDDRRGLDRLLEVLREELARTGAGRLVEASKDDRNGWPDCMTGGMHHMGTTRMHADPRQGVVDSDCRVHGLANLFVAGSSVFTTGGVANPTLTIVALAVRLADHLKRLGAGSPG